MNSTENMMADLRALLDTVEIRLRETMQVFAAHQAINRAAKKDAQFHTLVNANFSFWHACSISFGSHVIEGLVALTEPDRESATLQTAVDLLSRSIGAEHVPATVSAEIVAIHQRYKRFRNKLISHTDLHRAKIADEFDAQCFSWDSITSDLNSLCRAHSTLFQISAGKQITPPNGVVRTMSIGEWISVQTAHDTERVLKALLPALSTLAKPASLLEMLFREKFEGAAGES
jgi:hypothetical protein